MKKECIHCGIPFRLYEKGSLFIEGANDAHDGTFNRIDGWLQADYESIGELENLLELAGKKFNKERNAGLSNFAAHAKPLSISTLGALIARVSDRETVELINHGDLVSYLQPIVSLQNRNELYGYESLLRTEGTKQISPAALFSTAHETGLLSLLDKRAREAAIKAKKKKIPHGIKSFINFLPSTIYNPAYCLQHTFDLVDKYQIDPQDLVFEVVESEKIEDIQHLKKVLHTYKKQGMKVALDDVGTGFSTLDVLEMLNPDYVKIDRKYISYCDQQASNQEFLSRVLELAKKLNIIVLAEGVERVEELEYCAKAGVDLAQGYYLGKPSLNAQTSFADLKLA